MRTCRSKTIILALCTIACIQATAPSITHAADTDELQLRIAQLTEQVATLSAEIKRRNWGTSSTTDSTTIQRVQSLLRTDPSLYPEGLVTGFHGPLTTAALTRLQSRYQLPVTGQINPETLLILETISNRASSTNPCQNPLLQKTRFCSSIPPAPTPSSSIAYPESTLDTDYGQIKTLGFPDVRVRRNIAYGDHSSQRFDLYRPSTVSSLKRLPTVVMVHGGGWKRGDKTMENVVGNKVPYFTGRGYNFISINYPLDPIDPEAQVASVAEAVTYLQKNARRLGIDTTHMVLMGHSAGAHLVSLLTADADLQQSRGVSPWAATVSLDTAGYNIPQMMEDNHFPPIYDPAFGDDPAFWEAMSPFHHYTSAQAPLLLVCSTSRPDQPCSDTEAFAKKVTDLGGVAKVLAVDLNHGEINNHVGLPGTYTETIQSFLSTVDLP